MEGTSKVQGQFDIDLRERIKCLEQKVDLLLTLVTQNQSHGLQTQNSPWKKITRSPTRQSERRRSATCPKNETKTRKDLQVEILREEHKQLTERLDPSNGLMDLLVQSRVMDVSDSEKIQSIKPRKDKVRFLLSRLHRYGPQRFESFITALYETDPSVARKLQTTYNARRNNNNPEINCIHCLIKDRVDLGDIVDSLFKSRLIGIDFLEDYALGKTPQDVLWNHIFFNIKTWRSEENPVRFLQNSLTGDKYEDIVEVLNRLPDSQRSVSCTKNRHEQSLDREESSKSTCSREEETSSEISSVLWSETVSPSPNVKRTESLFDKRHDPTKHRLFVLKHSPLRKQVSESEGSLMREDIDMPKGKKLPNGGSLKVVSPVSKTKDPRRRGIYYPSEEDLAFAFQNAQNHSAGYSSFTGRRVQSFNYGQRTYPRICRKDRHAGPESRSRSGELL